ncbi:hypothetical protein [Neopusillimonas aromaticivorans]|uniref:hypothetical protein n=1 Tax=Neopusillimonas aromaticivorans TaxID=2979868 RepID=UPI002594FA4E|nr:hypothetical protein [Neopusillimonas aromaticivorans]WJJ93412.1 hypothetical protein N7E01_15835 [Neopusillimonas aromaticivorans]WJJ94032.1 hypothetical protein N7E01_02300 [Neopusillimonas aromaticivorans]
MFAKLFGTTGQVLVVHQADDNGNPCIRFSCKPNGLGVCSFGLTWDDTDEGWDKAEKMFSEINEAEARAIVQESFQPFFSSLTADTTEQ